jgi:anthranilate phosphoribosyltransferase
MTWEKFMAELCDPHISPEKKSVALSSVAVKDITGEMLAACARYLLERALPLDLDVVAAVDVCGTGGDGGAAFKTFNISTAAAFVLAAGGARVIKHGNRAVSSISGSSDVLDALGVPVCGSAAQAEKEYERHGLCFVSAPAFHPALKGLSAVRKSLGCPTFFNLLGPLCNPARTKRQVIGIFDAVFLPQMAQAARLLGKTDVLIVHAEDGLDEISVCSPTHICRLQDGCIRQEKIIPEDAGILISAPENLCGGTAQDNAKIILSVFEGASGPSADIICLNAAAGFMVAGMDLDLRQGVARAREAISSGLALKKIMEMRA